MFYVGLFFLLYLLTRMCSVKSDLGLREGLSCTTDGINGTCHNIYKCPSAALSHLYSNSGYQHGYPPIPEICSFDDRDPIVCCTDCKIDEKQAHRHYGVLPLGYLAKKSGPVSWKKCLEYFQNLPYPCRGKGNFHVNKRWNEDAKCHGVELGKYLPVGGRVAMRWEYPHMALLGYGDDQNTAQWLCGGSVISERYILTAAHCSAALTLGPIKYAALGILKRTDPKSLWKIYDVKRIVKHPEYKSPAKYHDIALLETETEINFGKSLLPICLDYEKVSAHSTTLEAAGWGRLGHRKDLADNLEVVNLEKFDESECASMYGPHRHLLNGYNHTTQMCFGSRNKIIDTCEGDSGGPLQLSYHKCLYFIIGVTSYGKACGILGSAGMYTRVSHYVPWIESVVWPDEVPIAD